MPLPLAWSSTSVSSAAASSLAKSLSVTVNTAHIVYLMSSLSSRALSRCFSSFSAAVSVISQKLSHPSGILGVRWGRGGGDEDFGQGRLDRGLVGLHGGEQDGEVDALGLLGDLDDLGKRGRQGRVRAAVLAHFSREVADGYRQVIRHARQPVGERGSELVRPPGRSVTPRPPQVDGQVVVAEA